MDTLFSMAVPLLSIAAFVAAFSFMSRRSTPPGGGGRGGAGPGGLGGPMDPMRMMSMFSKSKASTPVQRPKTKFDDVAGLTEAKAEIQEFVRHLRDTSLITKLGGHIPKGALLVGPPGTGKTLLARALAGEAGVPFFSASGSDFVEIYGGLGPARVRDLFEQARKMAPCILFIDEIDAVGRRRNARGGNSERENTLNQLLVEMDGFKPTEGLIILASTNRADILDGALLRPGRFDRRIACDLPTYPERQAISKLYLSRIKLNDDVLKHVDHLASMTSGMSGAQIASVCNEAALHAARNDLEAVTSDDLDYAIARVIGGLERPSRMTAPVEREVLAVHEAGHAVLAWMMSGAERVLQVSIVPRANIAAGFTQQMPSERMLQSKGDILDKMCLLLAGRAAEQVLLDKTTTSAHNDLSRVTDLAYKLVCSFGMDERLGPMLYPIPAPEEGRKKISDATAHAIDVEADRFVREAYNRALELVRTYQSHIRAVATQLNAKGTVTERDLVAMLGPRVPDPNAIVVPPNPTTATTTTDTTTNSKSNY